MMIVKESIEFKRGLDPKQGLGIGMEYQIRNWIDNQINGNGSPYNHNITKYTINNDMTIKVGGFIDLRGTWKENLPDFITFSEIYKLSEYEMKKFGIMNTFMSLAGGYQTSLRGCPRKIEGIFACNDLKNLKSLKGGPEEVSGSYVASGDNLHDFEGFPKYVGKDFKLWGNNKLIGIDGLTYSGDINKAKKEFEDKVRSITQVKGEVIIEKPKF